MSSFLSGSYTLSASSLEFPELRGEEFDGDISLRALCSNVFLFVMAVFVPTYYRKEISIVFVPIYYRKKLSGGG